MKHFADKVRSSIRLSEVVGKKVALKQKSAGEFLGLCPFHNEKTPSFTVSDNRGFYHCFGCNAHGSHIDFLMQNEGLNYREALEQLANSAGLELPKIKPRNTAEVALEDACLLIYETAATFFHQQLFTPAGKEALNYLKRRGLSEESIAQFRLGYAPSDSQQLVTALKKLGLSEQLLLQSRLVAKGNFGGYYTLFDGRVIFSIFNERGKVIAFGGRSLDGSEPKYINSSENPIFKKGEELFALNFARSAAFKEGNIVVVEGYMDAISLHNSGIKNVVAPLGTALKKEQLDRLLHLSDEPIFCMDNDAAGHKAMLRICEMALPIISAGKVLKFAQIPGAKDPDEALAKYGPGYVKEYLKAALPLAHFYFNELKSRVNFDIPEKVAQFKKTLLDIAKSIADQEVSNSYKKYFLDRFYEGRYQKRKSNEKTLLKAQNQRHKVPPEFYILALIAHYEVLLKDNEVYEDLVKLDFNSKELDTIRASLLSYPMYSKTHIAEEEIARVRESIKESPHYQLLLEDGNMRRLLLGERNLEEVRSYLMRLFDLQLLGRIELQMEQVSSELAKNPDEKLFSKLQHLTGQKQQLNIKLGFVNV